MERKDIFLDFMCPDCWKTLPTLSGGEDNNISLLCQSLNIAVLLTANYCILPPGFVAQSHIVKDAMRIKSDFLSERLVVFPLKESSLEEFFEKKQREYRYVRDSHSEFYNKKGRDFINKFSSSVISRKTSMGRAVAYKLQIVSNDSDIWLPIVQLAPRRADSIREIPTRLQDSGISITLEAIKKMAKINDKSLDLVINQAVQHEYLSTYLDEYDSAIVEDIPPKPRFYNFLLKTESPYYNYYVFKNVLDVLGIGEFLHKTSAGAIIKIRKTPEFDGFINLYWKTCQTADSQMEIKSYFAELMRSVDSRKLKVKSFFCHLAVDEDVRKIQNLMNALLEVSEKVPFDKEKLKSEQINKERHMKDNKIFIVHGHNKTVRDEVEMLCRRIGLDPKILANQPNEGMTIIEKLEKYSDVKFAIVLYTGCDEGRARGSGDLKDRARQNVVFEHGYMYAKLGRNKVIALVEKDVEIPGDLGGVVYISLEDPEWKNELMRELENAGFEIEWSKA